MICKNCGNGSIIDGSKFCNNCGARLKAEEQDGVTYYDPYIEEVVKKGNDPTCGRIGLGLYLGAVALYVIIGLKSGGAFISTLTVSVVLMPFIVLLLIGSLTLAIVSKVRKERGASANITISLIIVGFIYFIINVLTTF